MNQRQEINEKQNYNTELRVYKNTSKARLQVNDDIWQANEHTTQITNEIKTQGSLSRYSPSKEDTGPYVEITSSPNNPQDIPIINTETRLAENSIMLLFNQVMEKNTIFDNKLDLLTNKFKSFENKLTEIEKKLEIAVETNKTSYLSESDTKSIGKEHRDSVSNDDRLGIANQGSNVEGASSDDIIRKAEQFSQQNKAELLKIVEEKAATQTKSVAAAKPNKRKMPTEEDLQMVRMFHN